MQELYEKRKLDRLESGRFIVNEVCRSGHTLHLSYGEVLVESVDGGEEQQARSSHGQEGGGQAAEPARPVTLGLGKVDAPLVPGRRHV